SARGWDFALVVTQAELEGDEAPRAHASVSRALAAALVSTCRIDPAAMGAALDDPEREQRLARRVAALALHALGHLLGLHHVDDPESWMRLPEGVEALDAMRRFDAAQRAELDASLARVADRRLEEQGGAPRSALRFYLRAAWINR